MKGKRLLALIGSICLILVLAALPFMGACAPEAPAPAPPEEKPILMRYSSLWIPALPGYTLASEELGPAISEATNGRVKYEFYGGGDLYKPSDALMALQRGELEMTDGGFYLGPLFPEWDLFLTPFLFGDRAHLERFLETDAFKAMEDRLEAEGVKCVTPMVLFDFVQIFNSKRPVEKLEDLKGLKLRSAPYPMALEFAKRVGMEATSVPPLEVSTALETGMIDGSIDLMLQSKAMGLEENCPYVTICNVLAPSLNLVVSKKWWDTLPPDIQQALHDVLNDFHQKRDQAWRDTVAKNFADFEAAPGHVITTLDKAERDRWIELTRPIWEDKMAEAKEFREFIEAADAVR